MHQLTVDEVDYVTYPFDWMPWSDGDCGDDADNALSLIQLSAEVLCVYQQPSLKTSNVLFESLYMLIDLFICSVSFFLTVVFVHSLLLRTKYV